MDIFPSSLKILWSSRMSQPKERGEGLFKNHGCMSVICQENNFIPRVWFVLNWKFELGPTRLFLGVQACSKAAGCVFLPILKRSSFISIWVSDNWFSSSKAHLYLLLQIEIPWIKRTVLYRHMTVCIFNRLCHANIHHVGLCFASVTLKATILEGTLASCWASCTWRWTKMATCGYIYIKQLQWIYAKKTQHWCSTVCLSSLTKCVC